MSIYTSNNRLKQALETTKGSTISMGGITLLIVFLMGFLAVLPAYKSITDQLKNNEIKTKYLADLTAKKNTLDKLATSYKDNILKIEYFNLYSNPIANTETLIANVDSIAKMNNSQLINISITGGDGYQSPDSSPFIEYPSLDPQQIKMEFKTKISYIPALINSLEEFPLTLFIYTTNITQEKNSENGLSKGPLSENDFTRLTITGETYFWNQENYE